MKYQMIDSNYCGWADLKLPNVYELFPEFFQGFSMLITCLDSSPGIDWSGGIDLENHKKWGTELINKMLYVTEPKFKDIFEDRNTFNGFDEIFLFREKPFLTPNKYFTTDVANFGNQVPEEFLSYFKTSGAIRYLSDGLGLNFVCESKIILEKIGELEN